MKAQVAEAGIDAIIPTIEEELAVVAEARAMLGCDVLVADPLAVRTAGDKWWTWRALAAAGVPVPRAALPSALVDPATAAAVGWPCLARPRRGRGGRGVVVFDGPENFPALARLDDDHLVQELVSGPEHDPNVYAPPGRPTIVVVLEKTALRQGRTGNASSVRRVAAADVADVARRAVGAVGLTGPVDVDVRAATERPSCSRSTLASGPTSNRRWRSSTRRWRTCSPRLRR